jgi:hypothetical protein
MERTCEHCRWFNPQPGVLVERDSPVSVLRRMRMPDGGRFEDGGSGPPPTYGKCTAQFIGDDGQPRRFNTGNFATTPCNANDDKGVTLFQRGNSVTFV